MDNAKTIRPQLGGGLVRALLALWCTLILCTTALSLTACSGKDSSASDDASAAASAADESEDKEAQADTAAETSAAEEGADGAYGTWAAECTDQWNTPTAYAISELKGWQLETMLQEKGYTWNAEDYCWFDGITSFYVVDDSFEPLDDEEIGKLDKGGVTKPLIYYTVTGNYPTCKAAYKALVGEVMVSEDSEFSDDGTAAFGVAYGPSMKRFLIELVANDDGTIQVFVFNEEALQAGVFDEATGESYGSTIDEIFESLIGRKPGSQN